MSPLTNSNNNNPSTTNSNTNTSLSLSGNNMNNNQSAFKPLISDNHRMLPTSTSSATVPSEQYSSEISPYSGYNPHSQLSTQDYLNSHQNHQLALGVYKNDHDELSGYSYPRPVKLYDHSAMESAAYSSQPPPPPPPHQTGFRGDAPSPGASIIDLSTSSVTSLRTQGFGNAGYYDGQRYDRSPQSASSPHYSSPQMLSPQGQTLDLSVGRTR